LITQNDVRAIQLAKAALYAGIRRLLDRMGVDQIARSGLAGAFGSHIDPIYAMVLGMVPDCTAEKVIAVGNAAGTGARIALVNQAARAEIEAVVRQIEKVETATEPAFQSYFVDAMGLPNTRDPFPRLAAAIDLPAAEPAPAREDRPGRRRRRAAGDRSRAIAS